MKFTLRLSQIDDTDKNVVGGKSVAIAKMAASGLKVPKSLCLTTYAFDRFMDTAGLRDKILMEYYRKKFEDMRWEEIWDVSLRIKNIFLNTSFPFEIYSKITPVINKFFKNKAVVVRSSAIGEDSEKFSYAGIYESYVNIRATNSILKHIKLVWASLFSDAAILYRKETGLDVNSSKMAVVIQEFLNGQKSGITFSKSPDSSSNMMIEVVYGLNQGLVDGTVEPDRWIISRNNGRIISYTPSIKNKIITADKTGITVSELSKEISGKTLLTEKEVNKVYCLSKNLEKIFGAAQDSEWTYIKNNLYSLQSRPITTRAFDDKDNKRKWYLSLKRSLENLKQLRCEIQESLIPRMQHIAKVMGTVKLSQLSSKELADELAKRNKTFDKLRNIYWEKCIPLAHAVRLFGEIYNKQMMPEDPFEFTQLLLSTDMKSLERNRKLEKLAKFYDSRLTIARKQNISKSDIDAKFDKLLNKFLKEYGNPVWGIDSRSKYKDSIIQLLKQMTGPGYKSTRNIRKKYEDLARSFIDSFPKAEKAYAKDLLGLARVSYQLRDDDNIYVGKIQGQLHLALEESKKRLGERLKIKPKSLNVEEAILALKNPEYKPAIKKDDQFKKMKFTVKARQLTGQPAGEGLAVGKARIIGNRDDIFKFKAGEILVCDAIDPNMTFIVPIAAGIVERRGGMLIHGAIIAREYGLPCITGVVDAVDIIETGQEIVVDGYLGIVTINRGKSKILTRFQKRNLCKNR
jgi:pyruvate,water dikinase